MKFEKLEKNFERSQEILEHLFRIEFQKKIELLTFKIYPDITENPLIGYDIDIGFDILNNVDPDLDYINSEIKKVFTEISSFLNQYIIGSNGNFTSHSNSIKPKSSTFIVSNLDYVYGEKLVVGGLFSIIC
jgi:hypothetical protein